MTLRPVLALAGLLALSVALTAAAPEKRTPSYSTEVNVQPGATAGAYIVKVRVKDLLVEEVVAGASLKAAPGRPVTAESTQEGSGTVVFMSAKVEGTHGVAYTVTVKAGGKVVSEHTASIQL